MTLKDRKTVDNDHDVDSCAKSDTAADKWWADFALQKLIRVVLHCKCYHK